jgi:hypothetical protein
MKWMLDVYACYWTRHRRVNFCFVDGISTRWGQSSRTSQDDYSVNDCPAFLYLSDISHWLVV